METTTTKTTDMNSNRLFIDKLLRFESAKSSYGYYDIHTDESWCVHDAKTELPKEYSCTVITDGMQLIPNLGFFKAVYKFGNVLMLYTDSGTPMFLADTPNGKCWVGINVCSQSSFFKTTEDAIEYALDLCKNGTWFSNKSRNGELLLFNNQSIAFDYCSKHLFESPESKSK